MSRSVQNDKEVPRGKSRVSERLRQKAKRKELAKHRKIFHTLKSQSMELSESTVEYDNPAHKVLFLAGLGLKPTSDLVVPSSLLLAPAVKKRRIRRKKTVNEEDVLMSSLSDNVQSSESPGSEDSNDSVVMVNSDDELDLELVVTPDFSESPKSSSIVKQEPGLKVEGGSNSSSDQKGIRLVREYPPARNPKLDCTSIAQRMTQVVRKPVATATTALMNPQESKAQYIRIPNSNTIRPMESQRRPNIQMPIVAAPRTSQWRPISRQPYLLPTHNNNSSTLSAVRQPISAPFVNHMPSIMRRPAIPPAAHSGPLIIRPASISSTAGNKQSLQASQNPHNLSLKQELKPHLHSISSTLDQSQSFTAGRNAFGQVTVPPAKNTSIPQSNIVPSLPSTTSTIPMPAIVPAPAKQIPLRCRPLMNLSFNCRDIPCVDLTEEEDKDDFLSIRERLLLFDTVLEVVDRPQESK